MRRVLLVCPLLFLAASVAGRAQAQGRTDPKPSRWLNDYNSARAEAKRSGKPIMLVFRCEPCPDFAEIDAQVIRSGKEIADIADKFIRVRLTRIAGADLRLFEFDYDLTWFVFFLNSDETIYGRYGGRDAKEVDRRVSLPGLRYAMERALAAHQNPPKPVRRDAPMRAEDFPAAKRFRGCIHCHSVNEFRRAELKSEGKWSRDLLWAYPLPENVGITLEVDRGNIVKEVRAGSPADRVGLKAGSLLKQMNGVAIASFADASHALHKAPKAGAIPIAWQGEGKGHAALLEVAEGWRRTDLTWRPSLLEFLPTLPLSGEDLTAGEKRKLGILERSVAIRQDKFVHSTLKEIGLQRDDVIVGIDGNELEGTMEEFLAHIKREYLVGDKVTLKVLRDGKRIELTMTLK